MINKTEKTYLCDDNKRRYQEEHEMFLHTMSKKLMMLRRNKTTEAKTSTTIPEKSVRPGCVLHGTCAPTNKTSPGKQVQISTKYILLLTLLRPDTTRI